MMKSVLHMNTLFNIRSIHSRTEPILSADGCRGTSMARSLDWVIGINVTGWEKCLSYNRLNETFLILSIICSVLNTLFQLQIIYRRRDRWRGHRGWTQWHGKGSHHGSRSRGSHGRGNKHGSPRTHHTRRHSTEAAKVGIANNQTRARETTGGEHFRSNSVTEMETKRTQIAQEQKHTNTPTYRSLLHADQRWKQMGRRVYQNT